MSAYTAMSSDPDEAWRVLTDWDVDYFMIFIAAQKLQGTLYLLNGGARKHLCYKNWWRRSSQIYLNGFSGDYFWEDTSLGRMYTVFHLSNTIIWNTGS